MVGFGSGVVNNTCPYLGAGNDGGMHPLVLGKTSVEESRTPIHPPVRRTTVSSLTGGGASVTGPGNLEL